MPGRDTDIVKFFSNYPRLTIWAVIGLFSLALAGGVAWASVVYHQIYSDSANLQTFQQSFAQHLVAHNDEIRALNERMAMNEGRDIEVRGELAAAKRDIQENLTEIRRDIKELLKRR